MNASPSTAREQKRARTIQRTAIDDKRRREERGRRRSQVEEKKAGGRAGGQEIEILQKDKQKEQYLPTKEDQKKEQNSTLVQGQFPKISRISQIYTTKTKKFQKKNFEQTTKLIPKRKKKKETLSHSTLGTSTLIIVFVNMLKFSIKFSKRKIKLQRKIEDLLKLFKNILFSDKGILIIN